MSRPITRLLIANRGEIVCRIAATARTMGIGVVTVFASDDAALPHARIGDMNCELTGSTLAETYLNAAQLIALAKASGADAIHPGYGFLSENAAFARAVEAAGLIFVGPPPSVIAAMGDKAASRQLCETIGVPVIPGYDGGSSDIRLLKRQAARIGYPVLVKAAAGGGGKGMRIVEEEAALEAALAAARGEAKSAFGDDRLLLEKYLLKPRHIELQVFSDTQGTHLHLFERECSIQRRHQKILEESPAPHLPEATRARMVEAALGITRHIGYVGAGTVEFILDQSGAFYFLEMNTRLQVEHPVTEMVTGIDLVDWQLRVAAGEPLPKAQSQIVQHGHAIEVRLYAEDAARGFMPCPGTLTRWEAPALPLTRTENGYRSGNTVSASYDPMIAKLVAWGESRRDAAARLSNLLAQTIAAGITSNREFLLRVLAHPAFLAGNTTTDFVQTHDAALQQQNTPQEVLAAAAAAYLLSSSMKTHAPTSGVAEQSAWTHPDLAGFR